MKLDYLVVLLLLFCGIYSYVKSNDVEVIKLTRKARAFKFLQDIFGPSPSEICDNKGIFCPNVTFTLNPAPNLETQSNRRIIRHVHTKYHSLVPSPRPILRRITPAPPLKERLDIFLPFFPNNFITETNRLPIYNLNYHINEIGRNITNKLLLAKNINFSNQVTTPIYSTMPNALTHSLDDSIVSNARQNPWSSSQNHNSISANDYEENEDNLMETFFKSLEEFECLFYQTTFNKLLLISPANRQENGISFIQSALFLYLALLAISTEVDQATRLEIENSLRYKGSKTDKIKILKHMMSWLPTSSSNMKFRWTSRLVISSEVQVSQLVDSVATTGLHVSRLNCTNAPDVITKTLNRMVADDSGGAMRNTFEEDDIVEGVCSLLLTTVNIRARWRSAPTVLNGTRRFYDTKESPERYVRMIRINDIMQYAAFDEWNADAIEIKYGTPDLTLMMLIPRGYSIRSLAEIMGNNSIRAVSNRMRTMRVAATLPIYTLRMTLLLPGKLESMGISRLIRRDNFSRCDEIKLSHAVQRLMFWAEAGPNAFKDDGIEWDETPELELVVNRPYLYYVRWKNITLMNGNFVL